MENSSYFIPTPVGVHKADLELSKTKWHATKKILTSFFKKLEKVQVALKDIFTKKKKG